MRFLVIGLGSIGVRHAENLMALGHKVIGYDIGTPAPVGIELTAALSDVKDIDGCIIATPTSEHAENLHYALERGWWPVLVEKPIANKISERLVSDIQTEPLIIMMGNNLRFHPSCRLAKRYLEQGMLGSPIWAHIAVAQYNDKPQYRRDGVLLNWGGHEIDLALWLLGPAEVLAASFDDPETIADVALLHRNGCRSVVHLDYLTNPELRETQIFGDNGRRLGISITERWILHGEEGVVQPPEYQSGSFDEDYQNEMIAFVNAIQGKPWPGATAQDGLAVLRVIEDAKKAFR